MEDDFFLNRYCYLIESYWHVFELRKPFRVIKADTYCRELLISGVSTYSKLADRERLLIGGRGGFALVWLLRVLLLWHLCITYIAFVYCIFLLVWFSVVNLFISYGCIAFLFLSLLSASIFRSFQHFEMTTVVE